jgi:predicted DNA-binding transcriptional regulator AlpA
VTKIGEAVLLRKSGLSTDRNRKRPLDLSTSSLGQNCPQHYPGPVEHSATGFNDPLGPPLSIQQVAHLIGCSVWTVRRRLLPRGLPYFRVTGGRQLVFFRNQVIEWVLEIQKERR